MQLTFKSNRVKMKQVLFFALSLLSGVSIWSQTSNSLTMDEAVLGQFRQFAPQTIAQLQWIPGAESFTYVKDQKCMLSTANGKELELFTLADMKTWLGVEQLTAMPNLTWRDANQLELQLKEKHYVISLKEKRAKELYADPVNGGNFDHHFASNRLAYTIDNCGFRVRVKPHKSPMKWRESYRDRAFRAMNTALQRVPFGVQMAMPWLFTRRTSGK